MDAAITTSLAQVAQAFSGRLSCSLGHVRPFLAKRLFAAFDLALTPIGGWFAPSFAGYLPIVPRSTLGRAFHGASITAGGGLDAALILATGSTSFMLPLPGAEKEGVIGFRDINDVDRMLAASKSYKKAVVIGGGLLGLETAGALAARGAEVTVVDGDRALRPQAGPERRPGEPAGITAQQEQGHRGVPGDPHLAPGRGRAAFPRFVENSPPQLAIVSAPALGPDARSHQAGRDVESHPGRLDEQGARAAHGVDERATGLRDPGPAGPQQDGGGEVFLEWRRAAAPPAAHLRPALQHRGAVRVPRPSSDGGVEGLTPSAAGPRR